MTCEERFPKRPPVPWVAVAIAPASVCGSTSPWFSIARPRARSSSPRSCRVMPASTVTSRPSTASTRPHRGHVDHHAVGAGDVGERMARRRRPSLGWRRRPPGRARPRSAGARCAPGHTSAGAPSWSRWATQPAADLAAALISSATASIRSGSGAQCASASIGVSRRYASASSAAIQPVPAAVTAWR